MGYRVIARKYRPQLFEELVGQEPIATTLINAIKLNKISHAYLFTGPRGVGKTSCARILAKALNCEKGPTPHPCNKCSNCIEITEGRSLDVMEIDGASNRGIDEIRNLKERINFAPSKSRYKIYIIDEVHMLTEQAFNALLKTLEEPPPHVVFIMATTEPHKIPPTIISRTQQFHFKRIPVNRIVSHLRYISEKEKINVDEEALFLIASFADGSLRDALGTLDQLSAYSENKITVKEVEEVFGVPPANFYLKFFEYIISENTKAGFELLNEIYLSGMDMTLFIETFINFLRVLLLIQLKIDDPEILRFSQEKISEFKKYASKVEPNILKEMIDFLINSLSLFKYYSNPRITAEYIFLNLINIHKGISLKLIYEYVKSKSYPIIERRERHNVEFQSLSEESRIKLQESAGTTEEKEQDIWKKFIANIQQPMLKTILTKPKLKTIENKKLILIFEDSPLNRALLEKKKELEAKLKMIDSSLTLEIKLQSGNEGDSSKGKVNDKKEISTEMKDKDKEIIERMQKLFKGELIPLKEK